MGVESLFNPQVMGAGLAIGNDISQQFGNGLANMGNWIQYGRGEEELYGLRDRYTGGVNAISDHFNDRYGAMDGEFARQFQGFAPGLMNDYNSFADGLTSFYGNNRDKAVGDYRSNIDRVNTGYDDRYTRGMEYLRGQGKAERTDLDQRYSDMQASVANDASERGLGGTTIIPTLSAGIRRDQSREVNRLNEGLNRQYMAADAGLSGDALSARERTGSDYASFFYGSGADQANFNQRVGGAGLAMRQGLGQWGIEGDLANRYSTMANQHRMAMAPLEADRDMTYALEQHFRGLQFNPPPQNEGLMGLAGSLSAPPPPEPEGPDWFGQSVGAATNLAAPFLWGAGSNMGRARTPDNYYSSGYGARYG